MPDRFTHAYMVAAVWSSTNDHGEDCPPPLDETHSVADMAPETLASMAADCAAFQEANETDLGAYYAGLGFDPSQGGHDFWLTRNRHGAGFWDRYYGADAELRAACVRLTEASHVYGSCDLYVGDDGLLYT